MWARKTTYFVVVLSLVFVGSVLWLAITGAKDKATCPARVNGQCLEVEAVSSKQDQAVGLSKYQSYSDNKAMLFDFGTPKTACMWMKNMKFSIDIVWVNGQNKITKIEKNVTPGTYPQTFCADNTSYVLELNSGAATKAGLSVGQRLSL